VEDPVGDLIRHFGIFYEHVYLLEGYPKEAQPTLKELKLLGERIHRCLINQDGTLNTENVKRCEEAHMSVTLDGGFIQVVRGKAALRQKV
jgi:pentose-5-phosphate-3-epimerase